MTRRLGIARSIAVASLLTASFAVAGCSLFSNDPSTPPPSVTAPPGTSPATASALGGDYCSVVIRVNTDAGTMVNKTFVPTDKWKRAQLTALIDFTLTHRVEFLSITPAELKPAVEVEMQWMQAIKDAGYDLHTTNVTNGTAAAMGKITNYQMTQCGISYG